MGHSRVALAIVLLLVAEVLPGCASAADPLSNEDHPWHGYPAIAGGYIGYAPFAPFAYAEAWLKGYDHPSVKAGAGPFETLAAVMGGLGMVVVGGPFYIVSLPFELLFGAGKANGHGEDRRGETERSVPTILRQLVLEISVDPPRSAAPSRRAG